MDEKEFFLIFKETGTPIVGSAFADWRKDWHSYVVLPKPPPWPPLPEDFLASLGIDTGPLTYEERRRMLDGA